MPVLRVPSAFIGRIRPQSSKERSRNRAESRKYLRQTPSPAFNNERINILDGARIEECNAPGDWGVSCVVMMFVQVTHVHAFFVNKHTEHTYLSMYDPSQHYVMHCIN
jgi:hypothetical protein